MAKYRKRPVVIEAEQFDGSADAPNRIAGEAYGTDWYYASDGSGDVIIPTPEGKMRATLGDWLIRGVAGEAYPCKDAIFRTTYERVAD